MDPLTLGAIGAGAGALASGIGSLFGGFGQRSAIKRYLRSRRRALRWAAEGAMQARKEFERGPLYQTALQNLQSLFGEGPETRALRDSFRVAAAARGLEYGASPAIAEEIALGRYRQQMIGPLMSLAQLPQQIEASTFEYLKSVKGFGTPELQQIAASPLEIVGSMLASGFKGALGGGMIGFQLGGGFGRPSGSEV